MPQIKCTVTECNFNKDVLCSAPMIEVTRNNTDNSSISDQTKCGHSRKSDARSQP